MISKNTLIVELAKRTDLSQAKITSVLIEMGDVIKSLLKEPGDSVNIIPKYIKVSLATANPTTERTIKVPKTGEEVIIPAKEARPVYRIKKLSQLKV